MTRSLSSGTPVTTEHAKRTMWGFWVVFQSVSSPVAVTNFATADLRLDRRRDQALLDDPVLDHDVGVGERRVDVAAGNGPVERDVLRNAVVELRRACLRRALRIDDGRKRLVVDIDQIHGVLRLIPALGHDNGDAVADVADDVLCQDRIRTDAKIGVRHEPEARHGLQALLRICRGVNGNHARGGAGPRRVDAPDPRVRVGAPQDRRVHQAGQGDVVGVRRRSGDQPWVFAAPDARTEDGGRHRAPPAAAASCTARTMF